MDPSLIEAFEGYLQYGVYGLLGIALVIILILLIYTMRNFIKNSETFTNQFMEITRESVRAAEKQTQAMEALVGVICDGQEEEREDHTQLKRGQKAIYDVVKKREKNSVSS